MSHRLDRFLNDDCRACMVWSLEQDDARQMDPPRWDAPKATVEFNVNHLNCSWLRLMQHRSASGLIHKVV